MSPCWILLFVVFFRLGFAFVDRSAITKRHVAFSSSSARTAQMSKARRATLMSRQGPYFQLDRASGDIEFGATASLVTTLTQPARSDDTDDSIAAWLQDERNLALSLWDPNLIEEKEDSVYRLQLMTLQFVTIQLAPWVDMQMKTYQAKSKSDPTRTLPIFRLQSLQFDPNLRVLPGVRVTADSLNLVIDVAGEMRPTPCGTGVAGSIAFATTGKLPLPLRVLPARALQAASHRINTTVAQFALQSFQKSAQANYLAFQEERQRQKADEQ